MDCTQYPYRIARPGSVTKQMIEQILPGSIEDKALNTEKPIAPGMKYKHYSPDTPLTIVRHLERQPNTEKDWTRTPLFYRRIMKHLCLIKQNSFHYVIIKTI